MDIFREPVWFVRLDENGAFVCNQSVLKQLELIDKQLVVISIAGRNRSGKSYLLNRLAGTTNGTSFGATVQSNIKGIWILCKDHPFPYKTNQVIVVLDSAGLGDIGITGMSDVDQNIMTLALLLSSCFIYNIFNAFNVEALESLSFLTRLLENAPNISFQQFVLAVRDFSVELQDIEGKTPTPDEYMKDCLQDNTDEIETKSNEIRQFIRERFKKLQCHLFDQPCEESQLETLENLGDEELREEFKHQKELFVYKVRRSLTVKKLDQTEVDGKALCILVRHYLEDFNQGRLPCPDSSVIISTKDKNREAFEAALQAYSDTANAGTVEPKTDAELNKIHDSSLAKAVEMRSNMLTSCYSFKLDSTRLEVEAKKKFEQVKVANRTRSTDKLNQVLDELFGGMSEDVGKNNGEADGLKKHIAELRTKFFYQTEDYGGMREFVFQVFIDKNFGNREMSERNQGRGIPFSRMGEPADEIVDDIFREPVWFICSDDKGVFKCNPNVLQQLERIEKQLVVIAITGKYRTGKSYLMNRLAGQNRGFPLGATVESKTKGIWIWCREHPFGYKADQVIVLLDTEGLGDIRRVGGRDGDTKIMTLSLLLSSCFVYNIMSAFNTDALEKLDFVSHVMKKMTTIRFPQFVLAIRDFSLDLEDPGGNVITPDQYMTNCLKDDPDEEKAEINETRKFIRENFSKIQCHVFDRPCHRRAQFKQLEQLTDEDINEEFKLQADGFVTSVRRHLTVKKQGQMAVDGEIFCILVQKCVVDINNGCIPTMDDMFTTLVKEKNIEAHNASIQAYGDAMVPSKAEPRTVENLTNMHDTALVTATDTRTKTLGAYNALDTYTAKFEEAIGNKFEQIKLENQTRSIDRLRSVLEGLFGGISNDIKERKFHDEVGYNNFQQKLAELKTNFYSSTEDLGGMRDIVYNEFIDGLSGINKMLQQNQKQVIEAQELARNEKRQADESRQKTENLLTQHDNMMDEMRRTTDAFNQKMESHRTEQKNSLAEIRSNYQKKIDRHKNDMDASFQRQTDQMGQQHNDKMSQIRNETDRRMEELQRQEKRLRENMEHAARRNQELRQRLS